MTAGTHTFQCHYEPLFVILSYTISVLGAYCSLQWAAQIPASQGVARVGWLCGAAVAMGGGAIWSMHFIAMIACMLPFTATYDLALTLASLGVAILVTGAGLAIVSRGPRSLARILPGGTLTGLGVAAMHYTGMAALRLPARTTYQPGLVAASIVIAIVAATAALWIAFNLGSGWQRLGSSLVMGIAVCGMHYTGMAAAVFVADERPAAVSGEAIGSGALAYWVFGVTLFVLGLLSAGGRVIERDRSAEDLRRAHVALESQVFQRTMELSRANDGLRAENAERRHAEAQLVDSEARYRNLFERNLAGVYRVTLDGRMLDCNEALAEIFGFESREEALLQRTSSLYFDEADRARLIERLLREGTLKNVETRMRKKDGEAVWVLQNESLLPSGQGDDGVLEGTVVDITRQKGAEEALRGSEQRTRSIIDNMLSGLLTMDEKSVLDIVNPAAERIFGYSRAELVGKPLRVLAPEKPGRDPDTFLQVALKSSLGKITEWEGRRKNGEVFPFELSLFEFTTAQGRYYAGSVRDVTESREVEKLKAEFVSTVSHELRTPLASIRGSLGLLAGGAMGQLHPEAQDVVAIAERNVVRLVALINDILDLERLKTGKIPMHAANVPVSDLFAASVEAVRGFSGPAGVTLEVAPTNERVFVDADRITQVLVNFLSNAVKFSATGSTVTVSATPVGNLVEIRVRDQGRGIPPRMQQAIFERFRQVHASDNREKGGTGLGLAICKAIVEQHGGTIGVESEEGRGSTFWIRVPARRQRVSLMSDPHGLRGTALLVDDDEELLGILSRQLSGDGVAILTATTGPEAVRMLREERPGVLVLDLGLPVGNGYQVVEAMRKDRALSGIPLLVYSGRDLTEEDRGRLRLTPATRFLTKGNASDDDVRSAVLELLRSPSGLSKRS